VGLSAVGSAAAPVPNANQVALPPAVGATPQAALSRSTRSIPRPGSLSRRTAERRGAWGRRRGPRPSDRRGPSSMRNCSAPTGVYRAALLTRSSANTTGVGQIRVDRVALVRELAYLGETDISLLREAVDAVARLPAPPSEPAEEGRGRWCGPRRLGRSRRRGTAGCRAEGSRVAAAPRRLLAR
jgi:hypothetical protein